MIVWLLALALAIPLGLDLYMPVPEDNRITEEKIALGRRLFNDGRLSRDRTIACASCHDPKRAFSDGRPVAIGIRGQLGRRSAPTLVNRGYGRAFFWDGRAATLEEQVRQPIQDPSEMDMTLAEVSSRVRVGEAEIIQALATYVRSILSVDISRCRQARTRTRQPRPCFSCRWQAESRGNWCVYPLPARL